MEKKTPYAPNNQTELPLSHYRELYRKADPQEIAARTGAEFTERGFRLTILGQDRFADWPEFSGDGWTDKQRILLLRYLLTAKKAGESDTFAAYSDLPWGEVYDRNFRARCVSRMVGMYGTRPEAMRAACEKLGGCVIPGSGLVCEIAYMPGLKLRLILWEGDEEFPASGQILFSDNFPAAFAAEDRVIVCEELLSAMKRA